MIEVKGNMWSSEYNDAIRCVTTNGMVNMHGHAIMGKGIALQAVEKHPTLPKRLGELLTAYGNQCYYFTTLGIITFPTKHDWRNPSDMSLIKRSADQLMTIKRQNNLTRIVLPRPGCGNGQLNWRDVKAILAPILDDEVLVIH